MTVYTSHAYPHIIEHDAIPNQPIGAKLTIEHINSNTGSSDGSKGGARDARPPWSIGVQFHAVFLKNIDQYNIFSSPSLSWRLPLPWQILYPSLVSKNMIWALLFLFCRFKHKIRGQGSASSGTFRHSGRSVPRCNFHLHVQTLNRGVAFSKTYAKTIPRNTGIWRGEWRIHREVTMDLIFSLTVSEILFYNLIPIQKFRNWNKSQKNH